MAHWPLPVGRYTRCGSLIGPVKLWCGLAAKSKVRKEETPSDHRSGGQFRLIVQSSGRIAALFRNASLDGFKLEKKLAPKGESEGEKVRPG